MNERKIEDLVKVTSTYDAKTALNTVKEAMKQQINTARDHWKELSRLKVECSPKIYDYETNEGSNGYTERIQWSKDNGKRTNQTFSDNQEGH